LEAVDEKTFRMILNKPFGMVLEALGKAERRSPSSCARRMHKPIAAAGQGSVDRAVQILQG